MDSLIHGDGQPGGLVEVGVDVSEVGGVVMLNTRGEGKQLEYFRLRISLQGQKGRLCGKYRCECYC